MFEIYSIIPFDNRQATIAKTFAVCTKSDVKIFFKNIVNSYIDTIPHGH
jgi:hypothetical protein